MNKMLQVLFRIGLVLISLIYAVFFCYEILTGGEPSPLGGYLPIYVFVFVQIPFAIIMISVFVLARTTNNKIIRSSTRTDFWFFLVSIGLLLLYSFDEGIYWWCLLTISIQKLLLFSDKAFYIAFINLLT